jgi:hypothetical protein
MREVMANIKRGVRPVHAGGAAEPFREEKPMPTDVLAPRWGLTKRILFRFGFAYLALYLLPVLLSLPLIFYPQGATILQPYADLWHAVVPGVGQHVFQTTITVLPNGSGDTTYNYVELFCYLVLAAGAAVVWTLLDRKRGDYRRLNEWLRVGVRFGLAGTMIVYGALKVIKVQFPDPPLVRLLQPIGEASPMGLLWTFMGASTSYTVFTGLAEMVGGVLLTTRRTTLLGALVCAGVMAHVVMLNFCYDVPVKLMSSHMLALSVILIAPDARRLANLWLFNRAVEPAALRPLFARKWLNRGALAFRTLFVAGIVALCLYRSHEARAALGDLAPRSPLYGIWSVEEFVADGEVRPPLVTDATRWRRVIFDRPGAVGIQLMNDARQFHGARIDPERKTVTLARGDNPNPTAVLSYRQAESGRLVVEGPFAGRRIRVQLRRHNDSEFPLVSRGFHWINEVPFSW